MNQITILIADDHTLLRETLTFTLNKDPRFKVIGEAGTGPSTVEMAARLRPDIVIMDINLPELNGIEATKQVRKYSPGSKILAITFYTQVSYVRKMLRVGALGYVTKNSPREEMLRAIMEVQEGRKYICEEIKNILSDQVLEGNDPQSGVNGLSTREIEIITFIKNGRSSKEIADTLCISEKTVQVHRSNVLRKLNLKNSASLVNFINHSQLEL